MKSSASSTVEFDAISPAAAAHAEVLYVLRLYIIGTSSLSTRAISNIRKICEEHLKGRYELEVMDISQHPMLAKDEQIIAAPTLIKTSPLPLRRFIGDMSQTERIMVGLDLSNMSAKSSSAASS